MKSKQEYENFKKEREKLRRRREEERSDNRKFISMMKKSQSLSPYKKRKDIMSIQPA